MALIVSAQTGNFNQTTTWVGGVIPTVGDEARASDTHTVTITTNTTCDEISNTGSGRFVLNGGITLNANVTHKSAGAAAASITLLYSANTPAVSIINGNINGRTVAGDRGETVSMTGTGTLIINGNVTGSLLASGISNNQGTISQSNNNSLFINGNILGGVLANAAGVFHSSNTPTTTIVGNVSGGSAGDGILTFATSSTVNLTGNCFGGAGGVAYAIESIHNLNMIGNCFGGTGAAAILPGTRTSIIGSLFASEFASAITGGGRTQITLLTGPFYTSPVNGVNPVTATAWRWNSALNPNTFIQVPNSNLTSFRNFVTPDNVTNFPAVSNVRAGVAYGIAGNLTGTCNIPLPSGVRAGVPVDNTVGTAALTPETLWTATSNTLTASSLSGTIGFRLNNAATVQNVGNLIAAYNS